MLAEEGAHAERLLATLESLVQKQSSPSLSVSLVPSVAKGDKIGTISIKGELKKVNDTAKYLEIQLEQLVWFVNLECISCCYSDGIP
jgi:hypothetical protein